MLAFDTRKKVTEWMKFEPTAYKEYYFPVEVQKQRIPYLRKCSGTKRGANKGVRI